MEKETMATHTDDVSPKRPIPLFTKEALTTKRGFIDWHKRFWYIPLFLFCCGVLIVALPLVYVGYPNIAQGIVNGARINLETQYFTNPTNTTVGFALTANVTIHSIFHARLDAWNATLYNKGSNVPLIGFTVPAYKSVSGVKINIPETNAQILNLDAFEQFAKNGFQSETLDVQLVGKGGLKLGALPHITVNYNKTVSLAGLNGLKQLETTNLIIPDKGLGSAAYGNVVANTIGNVTINNPSVLSLQLGDTSFNITLTNNGTFIGNATIPDLTLAPGNNTYPLYLQSNINSVLALLQTPRYQCGILPVTVLGTGVVFEGNTVPYWTEAFQAAQVQTIVNITSALDSIGLAGTVIKPTCES